MHRMILLEKQEDHRTVPRAGDNIASPGMRIPRWLMLPHSRMSADMDYLGARRRRCDLPDIGLIGVDVAPEDAAGARSSRCQDQNASLSQFTARLFDTIVTKIWPPECR
jgi:hypothetical protein